MQMIPGFYFDRQQLSLLGERWRPVFQTASPFKHVVIDDFLPEEVLDLLIREFPEPDDSRVGWQQHGPGRTFRAKEPEGDKLATREESSFGPFTRHFMSQLNSDTFVNFIQALTGLRGLIVDPGFGGCGLHSTGRGGRLMIHTDVNRHTVKHGRLHQMLNAILYLNRDWRDEYRGHLQLWNRERRCEKSILPIANRFVLFSTGTKALHGHPEPLEPPPGRRRNSLAVYYYAIDRPTDADYASYQLDVNWLPTAPDDHRFMAERAEELLGRLRAAHGRTGYLPKKSFPSDFLPEPLALQPGDELPVFFFDCERLPGGRELRAKLACGSEADLLPFAAVGEFQLEDLAECVPWMLLLHVKEAKVFLAQKNAGDPLWLGYEKVLQRISPVRQTRQEVP